MNDAQTHKLTPVVGDLNSVRVADTKQRPKVHRPPPAALGDDALVDINFFAACGQVRPSWVYAKIRSGEAPKPAIQQPKFTRWQVGQVRQFWIDYVATAAQREQAAESAKDRATKASAAAKAARQARSKAATAPLA